MGLKKTLKGKWKGIDIVLNTFYIERNLMMSSSVNVRFKDYPNMDPVAYIKSHPEEFKKEKPAKTFKNNYSKRNSNTSSTYHLNKKEENLLGNIFAYVILGAFVLLCMVMC